MAELIYWNKYETPKPYSHKIGDKVYSGEISGEYICADERVESFTFIGFLSEFPSDAIANLMAMFIFKDGSRHEKNIELSDDENHIKQAGDFLKSIKE